MAILFNFKESYGLTDKEPVSYPQAINARTIDKDEFYEYLRENRNINPGQAKSVLTAVNEILCQFLASGHNVQVDGIGTFSVILKGDVILDDKGHRKLKNGGVKKVNLLPATSIMKQLENVRLEKASNDLQQPNVLTLDDAMNIANELLEKETIFNQAMFRKKAQISASYTSKLLRQLVEEGRLALKPNVGRTKLYVKP